MQSVISISIHFNLAVLLKGFLVVSFCILSWSAEAKSYNGSCNRHLFPTASMLRKAMEESWQTVMMCFVAALIDLMYPDCIPMADDSPTFTIPVAIIWPSPTLWSTIAQTQKIFREPTPSNFHKLLQQLS